VVISRADIVAVRQRAETLCSTLAARPILIALASEVSWLTVRPACAGFFNPNLSEMLRSEGWPRWVEGATIFLVNDIGLAQQFRLEILEDFHREFLIVALHELGHVLSAGDDDALCPEARALAASMLRTWVAMPDATNPRNPPWVGHDSQFVRACLHLSYRINVPVARLVPPGLYGLSHPDFWYRPSLGDECSRLASLPISEILELPPPSQFTELFSQDCKSWFESLRKKETKNVS
jgi:hypothetical protein